MAATAMTHWAPACCPQIINVFFLYYPPLGTARSDVLTYLGDHDGRLLSVLAGLLACFGDMAQFLAGQAVGYAVRPRRQRLRVSRSWLLGKACLLGARPLHASSLQQADRCVSQRG